MKKIIVLAFTLLMLCHVGSASFKTPDPARWEYINTGNTEIESWLDKETLKFSNGTDSNMAEFWMMIYGKEEDIKSLALYEMDLDKKECRFVYAVDYDAKEQVIVRDEEPGEVKAFSEDSIMETVWKAILEIQNSKGKKGKKARTREED